MDKLIDKTKNYFVAIILIFLFSITSYKLNKEGSEISFFVWLIISFLSISSGYFVGRMQVLDQLFEKNEMEKLKTEYKNSKNN